MSFEQRLPHVNNDDGQWGDILNQFLSAQHYNTGTDNAANGSHKTVTIQPGTSAPGTAPLKFTSGALLSTPEPGAVEFISDQLYFTQTTSSKRKKVAIYDDSTGAGGDMYYRDGSGSFVGLPIGMANQVLSVSSGLPSWQNLSASISNLDGGNATTLFGGSLAVDGGGA